MDKPETHGGGDANNPFCKYCTDEKGNLLPRETIQENMIRLYKEKQGKSEEEAKRLTDEVMGKMPAWKEEGAGSAAPVGAAAPSEPVSGPTVSEPAVPSEPKPESETPEPVTPTSTPEPVSTPEPASEQPTETTPSEPQPAETGATGGLIPGEKKEEGSTEQ